MYGFKPKSARGKGPQQFAEGGLIRGPGTGTSDSIKTEKRPGTFIMPADSTKAIGPEALERLGESEEMEVDDEREMDDDTEEGEESVPVRLSNGEFELPPEQVQALGEAVLTVLRDATHTPTGSGNPTGKGFAPNQFFANGGTVFGSRGLAGLREVIPKVQAMGYPQAQQPAQAPAGSRDLAALKAMIPKMEAMGYPQALADGGTVRDEEKQRLANQSAMYVLGAQTAAANRQPAPPEAAASQAQNKAPTRTAAPVATTAPTSAGFMPGTRAVFNESGKAIGDLANQGRYAAAAGETARAALAYVPAVVDDVVGGAVRAVGPALADAGKQFFGMNEATAPAPAPVAAAAAQKPSPAAPTGTTQAPTLAQQPSGNSPVGMSVADAQKQGLVGERVGYDPAYDQRLTGAPGQNGAVTRNGNSYAGTNVSGDITVNGQAPGGGAVSAQNMIAADALQARQTPAGFQPAGSQPASVQAPVVRNSTNDWAARKALENMATAASSITNRPEWQSGSTTIAGSTRGPRGEGDPEGKVAAYKTALANDLALQQAQPGMDKAAMDGNAALQREGIQQAGATGRTAMQEQGANTRDAGRNALTAEELGLRREAQGFQTRAAAMLERLQNAYIAEKDPAKRSELARQLREIQGKDQPARFKVAAGGQQIDANGVAYKVPDRVFNEQTGEFADVRGAAAPAPIAAPKAGEVRNGYRFKGGNPNDQANWTKV